jgi:hypothetical protein
VASFIEMNNQIIIIIIIGILSATIFLPTTTAEHLTLAAPNGFGQQLRFDNIDKDSSSSALDIPNNNMTDDNIVAISTTTGTNASSATASSNMTGTTPVITVLDVINSTYVTPKEIDEGESERRIGRAVRDRVNDVLHTVVSSNATIISTATVTNDFVDESTSTNNNTRLLEEIIPDQVETALESIRAISQPTNPMLELHSDIEILCIANNISLADCDIDIKIR